MLALNFYAVNVGLYSYAGKYASAITGLNISVL